MSSYTNTDNTDFYASPLVSQNEFARVRQTGYSVELSDTLSEGWKLVQKNIRPLIGFFIVAFFMIAIGSVLLSFIPFVGSMAISALVTVVSAGFYTFFIQDYKNQFTTFSDFFESFQDAVQLGVYGLISGFISYIPALILGVIAFIIIIAGVGIGSLSGFENGNFDDFFANGLLVLIIFVFSSLIMISVFLISMLYCFAPIIIITHKKEFWPAMELSRKLVMRNFSGNAGLLFVLGIINFIGMIPLGLGLLVTVPLSYACIFVLYVKLLQKNGEDTSFSSNFYGDEKAPLDAI